MANWLIQNGDCLEVLKMCPAGFFDAMITDPPSGTSFMGREWDSDKGGRDQWIAWLRDVMKEAMRCLKPGAHCLVWALPRTSSWTARALEDADFEVREIIHALHGQGFPKNLDVKKAAIKAGIACSCHLDDVVSNYGPNDLQDMSDALAASSTEPATAVLQSEVRGRGEAHAANNQDMPGVRQGLDSGQPLPSGSKPDLFTGMRREADIGPEEGQASTATADMPLLRREISTQIEQGSGESQVLHQQMRGPASGERPCGAGADAEDRREWTGEEMPRQGLADGAEPSMERGSDVQTEQGQLHRAEVCPVPPRMASDVSEGRIRDGASPNNGAVDRPVSDTNRSGSSHRPQHSEQQSDQPGVVAQQSGAQSGGSRAMCSRCGKPILPEGLGSATKPAVEHWILCRKPLAESSIARNVLTHGTGAINIDGCRVEPTGERLGGGGEKRASLAGKEGWGRPWMENPEQSEAHAKKVRENVDKASEAGRFPPNLLLTHSADCGDECVEDCPVAELDRQSGKLQGSYRPGGRNGADQGEVFSFNRKNDRTGVGYSESGGASRFFPTFRYQAKPSRSEKEQGLAELPERTFNRVNPGGLEHEERWAPVQVKNNHPTVKSIELMRWLCRLITPPGGMVLDPFAGSFTTGCAALLEGFRFFGIEQDPAYCEIGAARLTYWEPK